MSNTVLLDNINHADLKVRAHYSPEFGDSINQVLVFPTEFGELQREYPIFFRKDRESGEYCSVALLGLDKDENLFLDEAGWQANYVPAIQARGPFLIGLQKREEDGELKSEPMIHVDMDSPRVNRTEGEPVFLAHGGNSPYLERVSRVLRAIHEGVEISGSMFAAFNAFDLLEPVKVDVKLSETEHYELPGFYTVSQEKLLKLDGASLEQLNRSGFLQGAFLVISSLGNVNKLIELKNRKRLAHEA